MGSGHSRLSPGMPGGPWLAGDVEVLYPEFLITVSHLVYPEVQRNSFPASAKDLPWCSGYFRCVVTDSTGTHRAFEDAYCGLCPTSTDVTRVETWRAVEVLGIGHS